MGIAITHAQLREERPRTPQPKNKETIQLACVHYLTLGPTVLPHSDSHGYYTPHDGSDIPGLSYSNNTAISE